MTPRRGVLRDSCGRAAGARGRSRPAASLRPAPARPGVNRARNSPSGPPGPRQRAHRRCQACRDFSGGHQRAATAAGAPASPSRAPASPRRRRPRFASASRRISLPLGCPHHEPRTTAARDARRRRRKLRVVEQQQPVRFEQLLDPAPCALSNLCLLGGGGGIRTPGAFALRFSRPSPSTARPLLRTDCYRRTGGHHTHCLVREVRTRRPGSSLTTAASGTSPSTTRSAAGAHLPRCCRRVRFLHRPAEDGHRVALPEHRLPVSRAPLLRGLAAACISGCCAGGSGGGKRCVAGTGGYVLGRARRSS